MAVRMTDLQRKMIIADYVELGSYSAVAKSRGISRGTVRNIVLKDAETEQFCHLKKEENTALVLAYMEEKTSIVCEIIGKMLDALNDEEKLKHANPVQIATALGILIDKFTRGAAKGKPVDVEDLEPLARMLRMDMPQRRDKHVTTSLQKRVSFIKED